MPFSEAQSVNTIFLHHCDQLLHIPLVIFINFYLFEFT